MNIEYCISLNKHVCRRTRFQFFLDKFNACVYLNISDSYLKYLFCVKLTGFACLDYNFSKKYAYVLTCCSAFLILCRRCC